MSDPDRNPPAKTTRGVSALDPCQIAALAAFRRPGRDADKSLCADAVALQHLGGAQAGHDISPSLARRVYAGSEGTVHVVPGAGAVCYIAVGASGETMVGTTTTTLAAADGLGHMRSGNDQVVTLVGVLPDGGHALQIIDGAGRALAVPLSPDDGYWITVADPVDMIWTRRDGTTHHAPTGLFSHPKSP